MKILLLCFNLVGRGTYLRAFEFARNLVLQNHSVTIMAISPHWEWEVRIKWENGIRIVETPDLFRGPLRSGWNPQNVFSRLYWLKHRDFDLVHAFESRPTCIYPALYLKKRGFPVLLDWSDWFGQGGSVEERPNPLVRVILRPVETYFENHYRTKVDANTVICTSLHNRALKLGVHRDRLALIHNGFDLPDWKKISKKSAREALDISSNDFIIGYVGSLFPGDARLMAQAFFHLHEQLPKSRLLHIGRSKYGLPSHHSYFKTGPVDQNKLNQYLAACDVCWLTFEDTNANRGRFPFKFSNYLAAGKPIVVTDVGDVSKFVRTQQVGLTCRPVPKTIAQSTYRLYQDIDLRNSCANESIRLSQDHHHTWKTRTDQLLSLYKQVV